MSAERLTEKALDDLPIGSLVEDLGDSFFKHSDGDDLPGIGWVCADGERWSAAEIIDEADLEVLAVSFRPDRPGAGLSDDALIAEAGSRGLSVMDTVEAARLRALDEGRDTHE